MTRPAGQNRSEARAANLSSRESARLNVPPGVRLKNVDLKINLETLSFYIAK